MKICYHYFCAVFALVVTGCATTTPIKQLVLPPVSTIEGTVSHLDENGFTLTDDSGTIFVKSKLPNGSVLGLLDGEKVKVYGNLEGGNEKIFDGYVIKKSTGQQVIVTNPTPHFGFIIQSAFE